MARQTVVIASSLSSPADVGAIEAIEGYVAQVFEDEAAIANAKHQRVR